MKAIVENVSGVTLDSHYVNSDWIGTESTVIVTGGYVTTSTAFIQIHRRNHV